MKQKEKRFLSSAESFNYLNWGQQKLKIIKTKRNDDDDEK